MKSVDVLNTRVSQWGEGPIWYNNKLFYVDINGRAIASFDIVSGEEILWHLDQRVGFVVPCQSGRLLFGGDRGLFFIQPKSSEISPIYDPEPDLTDNRFNDGKCSPDGRLYAGTIATNKKEGAARLYMLDRDLTCRVAYGPVTNSNGIAWNHDSSLCYYIDTPTKKIIAFDYRADSGDLANPRMVVDTTAWEGSPDGMTIDENDNLWVAFCHGGCVMCFDPESGKDLERIEVPVRETTACTFGGSQLDKLFITTGVPSSDPEPNTGKIFMASGLGVKGRPAFSFADR